MAKVYPFKAYRPRQDLAPLVASVPYDVVNSDEARRLAEDNPHSFLHVTKPEIASAPGAQDSVEDVYKLGAERLEGMIAAGVLRRDDKPCFYIYELTMGAHVQVGIALGASVADYDQNIVRKHEFTRPDKEDDRVQHMEILGAQTGIVFLCHREHEDLSLCLKEVTALPAAVDFTADDAVRHRVWIVDSEHRLERIQKAFDELGAVYIADGHHRSAAASRVAQTRRRGDEPQENRSFEKFLCVSFPTTQMQILAYNRVVKDLGGLEPKAFLEKLKSMGTLSTAKRDKLSAGEVNLYIAGSWYHFIFGEVDKHDPVARLDVSYLQEKILGPILGIGDPRRDKRIEFVGGIRGDGELQKRVDEGAAVAFSMYPTAIEELLAIADAGEVMPPKSTWFEPKLRDGLFVHRFD